eukprot:788377-Amphidinium_carterae.2
MKDVHISARKAVGKEARLRRSNPLGLMAYGRPSGDLEVTADLNTICIWQRRLDAGRLEWSPYDRAWRTALYIDRGRGRGPIRHLRFLLERLGWVP